MKNMSKWAVAGAVAAYRRAIASRQGEDRQVPGREHLRDVHGQDLRAQALRRRRQALLELVRSRLHPAELSEQVLS